jgi:hypothetical protein
LIAWKVQKLGVLCDSARVKFTDESAILFWSASNQDGFVGKFRPQRTINFSVMESAEESTVIDHFSVSRKGRRLITMVKEVQSDCLPLLPE